MNRRLPRVLLNAATALCLVTCVTMAVLCVASVWYECKAVLGVQPYAVLSHSRRGEMALTLITDPAVPGRFAAYSTASRVDPSQWDLSTVVGGHWGFAARHDVRRRPSLPPQDFRVVVVPHWALGLLFALPVAYRWWPRRRPPDPADAGTTGK